MNDMKTRLQTLLCGFLTLLLLLSCEKDGYFVPHEKGENEDKETVKVEVYGTDVSELETVGPRTVLRMDGYTIAELYDPKNEQHAGTIMLLYEKEQRAALISYTEKAFIWYGINLQDGTAAEEFFAANEKKMMCGKMNRNTGAITEAKYFDMPSVQMKNTQTKSGDGMNFARKMILDKILRPLASASEYLDQATLIVPPSASPSSGFTSLVFRAIILNIECLMITDEMEREAYRKGQEQEIMWGLMKTTPAKLFSAISLGFGLTTGKEDVTHDDIVYGSNMFMNFSRYSQQYEDWQNMPHSDDFKLDVSGPYDLTKNSVKIKGSYKYQGAGQGANILQKGILWAKVGTAFPANGTYIAAPADVTSWETSITGLEEATTYYACAYLSSLSGGGAYYSEQFIKFTTKGIRLAVSPASVSLPAKGGSKGIYVDTNDNAEWKVISKPSWCTIDRGNAEYSFFVDIKKNASTKPRSGTITVQSTVTYDDGTQEEPLTATIAVSQEGEEEEPIIGPSSFSNTSWNINNGTVKITMTTSEGTETSTDALEPAVLTFGEVSMNKVEIEGLDLGKYLQSGGFQFSIASSTDTRLVLHASANMQGTSATCNDTFIRTSSSTISGTIVGESKNKDVRVSCVIEFTGTLIR